MVADYGNEYTTKVNKNWTSFKNFAKKRNLNHNIYVFASYNLSLWDKCDMESDYLNANFGQISTKIPSIYTYRVATDTAVT